MVTSSYGRYGQHAARMRPHHLCQIQLSTSDSALFFQRRPRSYCEKPNHIQSGWPGQGLAECIWSRSKLVCKNHQAWFWQNGTSPLPVSHFQSLLCSSTDDPDHIVQNQPRSVLVLADCVRFWPNGSGPEARRYAKIIRPASGQHFQANPDWMRIRSSMFIGLSGWSYVAKSERTTATSSTLKPIALGKLWADEESRQGRYWPGHWCVGVLQ